MARGNQVNYLKTRRLFGLTVVEVDGNLFDYDRIYLSKTNMLIGLWGKVVEKRYRDYICRLDRPMHILKIYQNYIILK